MHTLNARWQRFLSEMRSTYKSMDTEEKWDLWVVRPIGFVEALFCRRLHIHPNAITIVSILFGAASGYFFFMVSAMAMAGFTCPAVPPPVINMFIADSSYFF